MMRDGLPVWLAPGLSALGIAALLAGCTVQAEPDSEAAARSRPILVQRISYAKIASDRSFVGTIRPRVESDLGFRIAGKVANRLVNVGDVVRQGTHLATLDEIDLRLQMEQAEAELKAAQTAVVQADADLSRTISLSAKGWTAQATVDRQRSVTEEARSRLRRADRALELAKNAFAYAILDADADGVVTATSIEPGQVVTAGQAAIRLAHTAEREAVIALPESFVGQARRASARITLWSDEKAAYAAKLRELAPAADPATRTFLARFTIIGADDRVRLGMTTTVTLSADADLRVVRVPLAAILDQGKGPSMWILDGENRIDLRQVKIARYEGQDALVRGGIDEGDRYVRMGVQKLDPKMKVRVVEALQF